MKPTEHLLLALPASENYPGIVDYAIQMADKLSATITVALIYTCNEELVGRVARSQVALQAQKQAAKNQFGQLRTQLQQFGLDYKLVSIDGPFGNALLVASHSYHPDLIISVADQNLALKQIMEQVPNHLLLVPHNYRYRPIRMMGLAYNPKSLPNPQLINFISQFAKNNQATVEVIEFGQECLAKSPFSQRANAELDYLFRNITHRFYLDESQKQLADCISHYTQGHKVDIFMISGRPTRTFLTSELRRPLEPLVLQSNIPIMILK